MGPSSRLDRAEGSPARPPVLRHAVLRMTSRTTPVGILVIALAGLIAAGCSAQTNAVFQALLDHAGTPVSSPGADPAAEAAIAGSETATWWPHPDGYEVVLPAGWSGVALEQDQTDTLVDTLGVSMPGLAGRMRDVLSGTQVRVSAIASDAAGDGGPTSILLILAKPTEGKRAHAVKTDVREQINGLPGLSGGPLSPHDVALSKASGIRFDYSVEDPDLGELRVRSYLFRYSRQAYLVSFVTSAADADAYEDIFDAIADSLRFGV